MNATSSAGPPPLVGRDGEPAAIATAVWVDRLITLLGPGGVGKSALARAGLEAWRAGGSQGWLVDCTAVTHPDALEPAVLAAIGGPGDQSGAAAAIAAASNGPRLVVLDNLEAVAAEAGAFAEALLASSPDVRVLATSRTQLGSRSEREWAVRPLGLPAGDDAASVRRCDAGRLLEQRLRAIGSPTVVDDVSAPMLAALLRRVDGLPLAIELAAGRLRALTPAELLRRLEERGLTGLDDGRDPRRSLAEIVAASVAMLDGDERRLLVAGATAALFDLAYAEATGGDAALGSLERLLVLGLVNRPGEVEDASRFRVLETVRAGVLDGPDEAALRAAADAHAAYWLAATTALEPGGTGASLEWLDGWGDDLRRALDHLTSSDPAGALALWTRLWPLWSSRGRARDGLARFNRIEAGGDPTPALARALSRQVALRFAVDGVALAAADNDRALEVARASGDRASVAEALAGSVMVALETGDAEGAMRAADEAVAGAVDDPRLRVLVAQSRALAVSATSGEASPAARDAFLELVRAASTSGDASLEVTARGSLAVTHCYRGEYQAAARAATEAVRIARDLGSPLTPWTEATLAIGLAETAHPVEARSALESAAAGAAGTTERELDVLVAAASVLRVTGHARDALLAAAVARLAIASGRTTAQAGDVALLARFEQAAAREANEVDTELARRDAADLDPAAFLASLTARLASKPVRPERGRLVGGLRLTPREVEILTLVGAGRTDPEIAEALFISPKTASVHVANIKAKLELDTRVRLALRARELGLEASGE